MGRTSSYFIHAGGGHAAGGGAVRGIGHRTQPGDSQGWKFQFGNIWHPDRLGWRSRRTQRRSCVVENAAAVQVRGTACAGHRKLTNAAGSRSGGLGEISPCGPKGQRSCVAATPASRETRRFSHTPAPPPGARLSSV
eukprot:352223-Chlamydomonas_euryale.AAC.19